MPNATRTSTLKLFSKYSVVSIIAFLFDATSAYLCLQFTKIKSVSLLLGCTVGLIIGFLGLEFYCFNPAQRKSLPLRLLKYIFLVCFIYIMRLTLFSAWSVFIPAGAIWDGLGLFFTYGTCFVVNWLIARMIFNKKRK